MNTENDKKKPENPPIYPDPRRSMEAGDLLIEEGESIHDQWKNMNQGMTLRDHYAGLALQSILSRGDNNSFRPPMRTLAKTAYNYADAMLKAREGVEDV